MPRRGVLITRPEPGATDTAGRVAALDLVPVIAPMTIVRTVPAELPEPEQLPGWLSEEDLDFYAGEFRKSGFRGGLGLHQGEDQGLVVVVGQHMRGDLVRHRGEQRVAVGGIVASLMTAMLSLNNLASG